MRYSINFNGQIRDDIENDNIINNLKTLLDYSESDVIRYFFIQKQHTLTTDLNQDDALEYAKALYKAGVIVLIEDQNGHSQSIDIVLDELNNIDKKDKKSPYSEKPICYKKIGDHQSVKQPNINRDKISDYDYSKSPLQGDALYEYLSHELIKQEKDSSSHLNSPTNAQLNNDSLNNPLLNEQPKKTIKLVPLEKKSTQRPKRKKHAKKIKDDILISNLDKPVYNFSLAYILSPHIRANRLQFIIRIIAAWVLLFFTDHFFNLFLLQSTKIVGINSKTVLVVSLLLLIIIGYLGMIFIVQRLRDLNRPASYLLILLLPIAMTVTSQFSGRLDQMRLNELREIRQAILLQNYQSNRSDQELKLMLAASIVESMTKSDLHKRFYFPILREIQSDDISYYEVVELTINAIDRRIQDIQENTFHQEYRAIFIFGYITSFLLLATLFIMKGDKTVNAYGAQQPSELSKPMIIAISAIIGLFLITLIFVFFGSSYDRLRQEYDQMFFETMGFEKTI